MKKKGIIALVIAICSAIIITIIDMFYMLKKSLSDAPIDCKDINIEIKKKDEDIKNLNIKAEDIDEKRKKLIDDINNNSFFKQ